MSAWPEAAWVIRELTKKLQIEEKIGKLVNEVPIAFVAPKVGSSESLSPDIYIDRDKIPEESVWFITEERPGEGD